MPLTIEVINAINKIIDEHNEGLSDQKRADELNCHVAQIRSFLAFVRRLGAKVDKQKTGPKYSPEEKAILSAALKDAHAKIAGLQR